MIVDKRDRMPSALYSDRRVPEIARRNGQGDSPGSTPEKTSGLLWRCEAIVIGNISMG
jgi:hypothetical protein